MTILAGKIDESVVEILTSESGVLRYEEVSGETVNPFTVDADTLGGSTKEEIISAAQSGVDLSNVDATTLDGHDSTYFATATEMDECFQSVSNGKSLIASAITDKGISTAADATFQTMANAILSLMTGGLIPDSSWVDKVSRTLSDSARSLSNSTNFVIICASGSGGWGYYNTTSIVDMNTRKCFTFRYGGLGSYDPSITITEQTVSSSGTVNIPTANYNATVDFNQRTIVCNYSAQNINICYVEL